MTVPPLRRTAAAALVLAALAGGVVAVRWADGSDARAAHAEYTVARDARVRAAESVQRSLAVAAEVDPKDRPAAERLVVEARRVEREAADHADRLRAEWGARWRRLGLATP